MKNYLFSLFLLSAITSCKSQNIIDTIKKTDIIRLPEYYKEEGVIFSKDYVVGIDINNLQARYTPSLNDIIKTENIFSGHYNEVQKVSVDTKVFFNRWVRHYIGLIDKEGNKNIIVQLINNTSPRRVNKLLGRGWKSNFIIMLSDSFYEISTIFRINIDKEEMSTEL